MSRHHLLAGPSLRGEVFHCGPCPYLPDREFRAFHPIPNPPAHISYRELMDLRFRRSGNHLYRPVCHGCNACQPVRVDVQAFKPRKDQRRCRGRNGDLTVSWHPRGMDQERLEMFRAYQIEIHGNPSIDVDTGGFLVEDGGIPGGELQARDAQDRLIAVSVCDVFDDALSSVYCYYRPDMVHRAMGTFMALAEIDHCRLLGLRWWYLGFLVKGCSKMDYKARYRPQEILEDGVWVRHA